MKKFITILILALSSVAAFAQQPGTPPNPPSWQKSQMQVDFERQQREQEEQRAEQARQQQEQQQELIRRLQQQQAQHNSGNPDPFILPH
jgi:TolA-binding protein